MISGPIDISSLLQTGVQQELAEAIDTTQSVKLATTDETVSIHNEAIFGPDVDELEELADGISSLMSKEIEKAVYGKADEREVFRKLQKLFDLLPDLANQDRLFSLSDLVRELLEKNPGIESADICQFVREKMGVKDPSHLYVCLRYLRESFSQNPEDQNYKSTIEASIKYLVQNHGSDIKSGLNITRIAFQEAQNGKIGTTESLRDDYRSLVIRFEFSKTFLNIVKKYGIDNYPRAVQYLYAAAGADMGAAKSSVEPSELQEIREGLYQMASMQTVLKKAMGFVERLAR